MSAYHGDPSKRRDALADGREVVEEVAAAVALAEALDLRYLVRHGLQQQGQVGGAGLLALGRHLSNEK